MPTVLNEVEESVSLMYLTHQVNGF